MPRKFPALRPDGSFGITAIFQVEDVTDIDTELVTTTQDWLTDWIQANDPWVLHWSNSGVEAWHFQEDFAQSPHVGMDTTGRLLIHFEGRLDSKNWKNWLVRIARGIINRDPKRTWFVHCESDNRRFSH